MPKNAEELYKKAIPDKTGTHWYAIDKDGTVHRFGNSNDGKVHWNGDSKQNRGIKAPSDVQKRLNEIERDKKNGTYGKKKDC